MAYMNQEKKKAIVAYVRKVLPKGWKYSFRVRNYSTLVMTIQFAPIDLVQIAIDRMNANKFEEDMDDFIHKNEGYLSLNTFYLESYFQGDLLDTFRKINLALNTGNHDNSDSQIDYFDVGFYTQIDIGYWDKPFIVK